MNNVVLLIVMILLFSIICLYLSLNFGCRMFVTFYKVVYFFVFIVILILKLVSLNILIIILIQIDKFIIQNNLLNFFVPNKIFNFLILIIF
jgi:hypothetical protein